MFSRVVLISTELLKHLSTFYEVDTVHNTDYRQLISGIFLYYGLERSLNGN